MNDSNYVFTQPEPSMELINSGTDKLVFQPTSLEPVVVENIVTSKLRDPDDTYHVQKPPHVTVMEGVEEDTPVYCAMFTEEVEDSSDSKSGDSSTLNLDNFTMENIRAYIEGITPEQWKKYALITGGVLLGRRILFGGKK